MSVFEEVGSPPEKSSGGAQAMKGFRFQASVGAYFASDVLLMNRLDERLGLCPANAITIRFESSSPVDDILIETSRAGFVAIQSKLSVQLSKKRDGPLAKSVSQFVDQWRKCKEGDGSLGWNRPLDPNRDRLVLAVSDAAPSTITRHLAGGLGKRALNDNTALNRNEQKALRVFESLARSAWSSLTDEDIDPRLIDELVKLVVVLKFDADGAHEALLVERMRNAIAEAADLAVAKDALVETCSGLIRTQKKEDLAGLRSLLISKGVPLRIQQDYASDVEKLQEHTRATIARLNEHMRVVVDGGKAISVSRECQQAINSGASQGSFLVIGEPGSGKSGVICGVAQHLLQQGQDVLAISVDRVSVETLEGFSRHLELRRPILEVLRAWDGPDSAWLILDALDAVRGSESERAFRTLIEGVLEMQGRWKVVASIRSFDLRMGQRFRSLFEGNPASPEFSDDDFSGVRHVLVPIWSELEFVQLKEQSPLLSARLLDAPSKLNDLLKVPFNTQLFCELLRDGVSKDMYTVSTQTELLSRYWDHRIGDLGTSAEICLRDMVGQMIDRQKLTARKLDVATQHAAMLDSLQEVGVVVSFDDKQWLQFRHHILFDYAAARVWLNAEDVLTGQMRFGLEQSVGLMLAPALAFLLQGLWQRNSDRKDFWTATRNILAREDGDPILKSVSARLAAELPATQDDIAWLAEQVNVNNEETIGSLKYMCGALGVLLDEDANVNLTPWSKLLSAIDLSEASLPVALACRFLLFKLIGRSSEKEVHFDLGLSARALLDFGYRIRSPSEVVVSAIDFVAKTFGTEPNESRRLLLKVFDQDRLKDFAWVEVPAICRNIETLAAEDPALAEGVYRQVFAHEPEVEQETYLGSGRILPLVSNVQQDYRMASYSLKEFYPSFLANHPDHATRAAVHVVHGYVAMEHPVPDELDEQTIFSGDEKAAFQPDKSHWWACDPEPDYPDDAEEILVKLVSRLKTCSEDDACRMARLVIGATSLAVFWSRLFMVAALRRGALLDILLPFALQEPFLIAQETQKDAIDLIAAGFGNLIEARRKEFEESVYEFDFSQYAESEDARQFFALKLFSAIGEENLTTPRARNALSRTERRQRPMNQRALTIGSFSPEPSRPSFDWIKGLDRGDQANTLPMKQIQFVKQMFTQTSAGTDSEQLTLEQVLAELQELTVSISAEGVNPQLVLEGEAAIGEACKHIVSQNMLSNVRQGSSDAKFMELLAIAARSQGPELNEGTESSYEEFASYPSPAARVEVASAILSLIAKRPDMFDDLEPQMDQLLDDPHPAVRHEAGVALLHLWHTHRSLFWRRLRSRIENESNLGVIGFLVTKVLGRLVHMVPELVEPELLKVLDRFGDDSERNMRSRKKTSVLLAILWFSHGSQTLRTVIQKWINAPGEFVNELEGVLTTIRGAFAAGLESEDDAREDQVRQRAFELAENLVKSIQDQLAQISVERQDKQTEGERIASLQRLENTVCAELRFSVGKIADEDGSGSDLELGKFFNDAQTVLLLLSSSVVPRTIHELLELVQSLLPVEPLRTFDIAAKSLLHGGREGGYQFESMGKNLLIKLIGIFLADHKEIFESRTRQIDLIKCLALLADAGWPEAQQLLFRLPELVR
ncbi:MAG: hypothetical protein OXC53_03330 [Rhodobacteraceae bacterium]|nr:hypothetical protein [Gammaproteobacteria bacterium]MCY4326606.1 hypothetical protein [Paracoccaceae bacterium]